MTEPWILCVDDEQLVLDGLELQLGFDHEVRTALGGEAGLALLDEHPNCAVIISDMRMPGMNGAQFLTAARERTPDATRMLLTGFSDLDAAVAAINEGGIFRFLTKPTAPDVLNQAVDDGIRQWELIQSERVLLEQTLHGAADALIEALEIASPAAFSRARRLESASRHVAEQLDLTPVWEVALAGLLHRLGWIAVPTEIIETRLAGNPLRDAEAAMFDDAYATGLRLIGNIPRLDGVGAIIDASKNPSGDLDAATVVRAVADFDDLCHLGKGAPKAIKALDGSYPREILLALNSWDGANEDVVRSQIRVFEAISGMVAEEDILTRSGSVLVRAGADITETVVQRLRNFAGSQGVQEPITVSVRVS